MLQMPMHLFAHVLMDSQDKLALVIKKANVLLHVELSSKMSNILDFQIPVMPLLATIKGAAWLMLQLPMHLFAHALGILIQPRCVAHVCMDSQDQLAVVNLKENLLLQVKVSI